MCCYLCNSNKYSKRLGSVRDNPSVKVLECNDCGLVFLSSFSHVYDGFYEESGMHDGNLNIDQWLMDTKADDTRRYKFIKNKICGKSILDFGCGIGGFIEMSKKSAHYASGIELDQKLQPSFNSRGLKVFTDMQSAKKDGRKYDVITAFHVIEHLHDPRKILKDLSTMLSHTGEIIVEVPNANDVLLTLYECEAFQRFGYWSKHLYLFNAKTLENLVKQSGLKLNWIKHIQRYQLSNHLYWLSKGEKNGHQKWSFLNSKEVDVSYENLLAQIEGTDTIIASVSC